MSYKSFTQIKGKVKYLTKDEITKFFLAIPTDTIAGQRDNIIFKLMGKMGLRASEVTGSDENPAIRGVCVEDIDFENGVIQIFGKGEVWRTLTLDDEVNVLLRNFISDGDYGKFILSQRGTPMHVKSLNFLCNKYRKLAGITKWIHPHMFRHTYSIYFLLSGGNIRTLQLRLGHSYISSTMVYLDVTDEIQNAKVILPY